MDNKKKFWRSLFLSSIIIFNALIFLIGICVIYKNMHYVNYGEYVNPIEITDDWIRLLDFYIKRG